MVKDTTQVDVETFMFNEKFVVGIAQMELCRLSSIEALYLGYGYDLETTNLDNYNSGSHEIFLRYELFRNNNKMTTQRFFKNIIMRKN
jgi:hypothetical protein